MTRHAITALGSSVHDRTAPFLRHPIRAKINGETTKFLTVGHLALAAARSTWTIDHWIRIGLLAPNPFVLNADVPLSLRRLWPEDLVDALHKIAEQDYVGTRLDYVHWTRFQAEVWAAHNELVMPLLANFRPVILPSGIITVAGESTQGKGDSA